MVDDIIFDREGCRPYVHIAANEQQRLKNLQSKRITEEGLGAHAVRHLFGAQLKKKLLSKEDCADLLGHRGDGERYCEPHELDTLFEFIRKLKVVTGHLEPPDINLIPWVENMEVAPFAQPSRAKVA